MAVDFGTKRLGVAVTDSAEAMALPIASFPVKSEEEGVEVVLRIARERAVREIILGLPKNHSGGETEMSGRVRAFAEKLIERGGVPVTFSNERYTTVLAEAPMMEAGMSAKKRRGRADAGAATILLQAVLNSRRTNS